MTALSICIYFHTKLSQFRWFYWQFWQMRPFLSLPQKQFSPFYVDQCFLVATKRLYMRVCPSVRWSVRPSVCWLVGDAFAFWSSRSDLGPCSTLVRTRKFGGSPSLLRGPSSWIRVLVAGSEASPSASETLVTGSKALSISMPLQQACS